MDISPRSSLIQSVQLNHFVEYLELKGWQTVSSNERWHVFEGSSDINGNPLEIVLPNNSGVSDLHVYLANTVNLLSALNDESPEITVKRINYYDSDVLNIRNVETGDYDSIPLKLASRQIANVKQLIAYSASSEREPRPHFNAYLNVGGRMIEHYRFGHTFPGSFGVTIESPLNHDLHVYQQKSLFDAESEYYPDERVVVAPIERRVMERVVRGLDTTRRASQERRVSILVENYGSGFNSNMCSAVVNIAREKSSPIEYSVLWSPILQPSDDVNDIRAVRLNETSYDILNQAAEELKEVQPEYVRIRGLVTELSSAGDPLGDTNVTRSVAIRWINRPENARPVKVVVSLNRDDYVLAHDAHLNWHMVEVTGVIQRVGGLWRLVETSDFTVSN